MNLSLQGMKGVPGAPGNPGIPGMKGIPVCMTQGRGKNEEILRISFSLLSRVPLEYLGGRVTQEMKYVVYSVNYIEKNEHSALNILLSLSLPILIFSFLPFSLPLRVYQAQWVHLEGRGRLDWVCRVLQGWMALMVSQASKEGRENRVSQESKGERWSYLVEWCQLHTINCWFVYLFVNISTSI